MPELSALPTMAVCSGGMFRMGTPQDRLDDIQRVYGVRHRDMFEPEVPAHDVELAPFAIDKRLVTNAQFHAFLLDQPAWRPGHIAAHLHNGEYLRHWQGDSLHPNPIAGQAWGMLADPARIASRRVIRGGSWGGSPVNLRVAYRDSHPPTGAGPHVGFRCAQSLNTQ